MLDKIHRDPNEFRNRAGQQDGAVPLPLASQAKRVNKTEALREHLCRFPKK